MTIVIALAVGLLTGFYIGRLNRTITVTFDFKDDKSPEPTTTVEWQKIDVVDDTAEELVKMLGDVPPTPKAKTKRKAVKTKEKTSKRLGDYRRIPRK